MNRTKLFGRICSYCGSNITTKINFNIHRRFASQPTVANVFDRKAKLQQRITAFSQQDCEIYDYIKDEIALNLIDRIADVKREFPLCLDLGCGRGHVSKEINTEDGVNCMIQTDVCREAIESSIVKSDIPLNTIFTTDEGKLPFRDNSFDVVLSASSLHWVNNLPAVFQEIKRVLKPDGCFIGAMFGVDCLFELRCSLQLAEAEREGGMSPHVSPMMQGHQLSSLLFNAGFSMTTIDYDQLVVTYPSMFELMEDLKGMGENSAIYSRKSLQRDTILAASAVYRAMYGDEEGNVPATYQILYMIGWKPDPTQKKALKPGSVPKGFKVQDSS